MVYGAITAVFMGFVNQLITVSPHTVGSQPCGLERSIFFDFRGTFLGRKSRKISKETTKMVSSKYQYGEPTWLWQSPFLVGALEHEFCFSIQLGISSSQLTILYFSEG